MLGETFELHALPGTKNTPLDDLRVFASGFGGDPNNFAKLDFSKSKYYEFSAMFRRDRQYFDYDLLGNPGIPSGYSIPIGPSTAPTGSYAWPQVTQSPFMFNTVRRMTDTNLTLLPLSTGDVPLRVFAEHLPGAEPDPERQFGGRTGSPASGIPAQQHRRFHGRGRLEAGAGHQADL